MVENGEVSATVAIHAVRKDGEQAGAKLKAVKTESGEKKVTAKAFKPSKAKIDAVLRAVKELHSAYEYTDLSNYTIEISSELLETLLTAFEEMNEHGTY